jgi:hypothetical protein
MRTSPPFEFPPEQEAIFQKARRLELVSVAYIGSAAVALYVTMGSSQAMRTSFFEDVISSVPPIAFLLGTAVARRKPSREYPYALLGRFKASLLRHSRQDPAGAGRHDESGLVG